MAASPRFNLYIKEAGTCPFSQRAYMFMLIRVPKTLFTVEEIDIRNKPKAFLAMNPGGKVPLLVDHSPEAGPSPKIVPDSAEIVKYVDARVPKDAAPGYDLHTGHEGEAASHGSLFSLFAKYFKNKDPKEDETHKQALLEGFDKFEEYLNKQGSKYLLGDRLTEPDCMLLPRLNQIRVAGEELKGFTIPERCRAVRRYLEAVSDEEVWNQTCPTNEAICDGWKVHV